MRLLRLRLINYIGIYNGMGINHIDIDFSKCSHKILVMKGDNGSGKSTIYRALSPMNDSTVEFISGKDASKLISYLLDDGSRLDITYSNQAYLNKADNVWRFKPARCSIIRTFPNQNPIELNPTSNVTTGKDILCDLFRLDDNFIVLSALSATNKGIGMQRPAERKKYVNVIIDSLGEFININKFLAKKGSILRSMMNSLTTKLSQIGSIELTKNQLEADTRTLKDMEIAKNHLIEVTTSIKNRLSEINRDGEVSKLYSEELDKYTDIKSRFSSIDPNVQYSEEELQRKSIRLSQVSTEVLLYREQLKEKTRDEEDLRKEITDVEAVLTSYPDISNKEDTSKRYEEICKRIEFYENEFSKIGFYGYDSITELEYSQVLHSIEKINALMSALNTNYSSGMICDGVGYIKHHNFHKEDYNRLILSLKNKRDEILRLFKDQEYLKEQSQSFSSIPKDCNHINSCPFISSIVLAKSKMWDEKYYSEMVSKRDEITQLIEQTTESEENQSKMIQCMNDIESLINFISSCSGLFDKFFGKKYFKSSEDIYHLIRNSLTINLNIQKYIEYTNYISILKGLKEDKKSIEDLLDQYKDFNKNQSIHLNQYKKLKEKLDTILEKKRELLSKVRALEEESNQLQIDIDSLNIIKSSLGLYKQLAEEMSKSNELVKDLKSKVEEDMRLKQDLQVKSRELNQISMTDMPIISNRIEKAKYQMILYDQYKKDFDEYNAMNTTLQKVLYYSSTKGIQSVYIEAFMNSMLQLTNQLLGLLFNGRFMIKQFIVKENEFSIPCIDASGQERDDIAEMSDSQLSMISMIISFVILHKASEYYNIIKLDEVDANLDNTNRLQFAVLINKVIDILNFHQCIIISHNNEIDLSQVDMAIFKIEKEEELRYLLNSGANVIFNYNRM